MHGAGEVAFALGLRLLVAAAAQRGDLLQVVGSSVFAVCGVLLYAASTIYHALPPSTAFYLGMGWLTSLTRRPAPRASRPRATLRGCG